jgi:hypothetical protein
MLEMHAVNTNGGLQSRKLLCAATQPRLPRAARSGVDTAGLLHAALHFSTAARTAAIPNADPSAAQHCSLNLNLCTARTARPLPAPRWSRTPTLPSCGAKVARTAEKKRLAPRVDWNLVVIRVTGAKRRELCRHRKWIFAKSQKKRPKRARQAGLAAPTPFMAASRSTAAKCARHIAVAATRRAWFSGAASAESGLEVPWEQGKAVYRKLLRACKTYPSKKKDAIYEDIRLDFKVYIAA